MDVLADVLNTLHLRSSLYCRSELGAPWGLHFLPVPGAVFHVLQRGGGYLSLPAESELWPLQEGDVIVLPRGEEHTLLESATAPLFRDLRLDQWGECALMRWSEEPTVTVLCGVFDFEHRGHPLFELLPRVVYIPCAAGHAFGPLLRLMAVEAESNRPGKEVALRRLADLLCIEVIRHWVETHPAGTYGWLGALRDPYLGRALALMHCHPERAWTVTALAEAVALSRSAFAARFAALVGEPPVRYLTRWRIRLAAHWLRSEAGEMGAVARRAGYESEAAFSKAFKREVGLSPGAFRRSVPKS